MLSSQSNLFFLNIFNLNLYKIKVRYFKLPILNLIFFLPPYQQQPLTDLNVPRKLIDLNLAYIWLNSVFFLETNIPFWLEGIGKAEI